LALLSSTGDYLLKLKLNVLPVAILGALLVPATFTAVNAQSGIASIYSTADGGTKTASGRKLSNNALTAAHKSLKFGTKVRVTNKKNGRSVVVTITDRGPFVRGRVIDLTPAGARALGFSGLAPVSLAVAG
jgi:rare lipoprotein A